jgi:hypothetical protein
MILSFQIVPLWVAQKMGTEAERSKKIQRLRELTANWGAAAKRHIFGTDAAPLEPVSRMTELVTARAGFRQVAGLTNSGTGAIVAPVERGAELVISGGRVRVVLAPFLQLLDGIEVWRIRECPICRNLFWAGRRDKSACSQRCSGTLRQKNLRQNRAYKKRSMERKKRNG